jgi:CLIP-associating protein 1/2
MVSLLSTYLPLIPTTPQHYLRLALHQLLPQLLEKVNDPKERIHSAASLCIIILGKKCYASESGTVSSGKGKEKENLAGEWEESVRETLAGKGWRGKVEGMKMLLKMKIEMGTRLPLKPWLPFLVDLLEDGDSNVREQAKEVR